MIAEVRLNSYSFSSVLSIHVKITDPSNVGDVYALEPMMWSIGSTIA